MQRVFQGWQSKLQRITQTDELQLFKVRSQERLENLYNLLEATKVNNTDLLVQIESLEKIIKEEIQKTMELIENKKNRSNNNGIS